MSDMPRKLPPYVNREIDRHGKVRFYFRIGKDKRTALPDPRDKQAFDEAYKTALTGQAPKRRQEVSGTLAWLVTRYKESARFAALAPSTRKMRDQVLQRAVNRSGNVQFGDIRKIDILHAMEQRRPNAANNFRKIMHALFDWAVTMEYLTVNPCHGVKPVTVKTDGFHTWTVEEVYRFWQRWPLGTRQRLAMDLMLFTGLRRSDIYQLGRQHVANGWITFTTRKTGERIEIPVPGILQASIDAAPTGDLTFIVTDRGLPFASEASFGNWFRKACLEAGVPGRAHGLRKAGATIAAEQGATEKQLMAQFGWKRSSMAELYTRRAEKKRLSVEASERIANAFAPNLPSGSGKKPKKTGKTRGYK